MGTILTMFLSHSVIMRNMVKMCGHCRLEKPISEFGKRGQGRHQSYCKLCQKETKANWAKNNRDKVNTVRRRIRAINSARILVYLREHPCVDCGNPDPRVLEFDHKDSTQKFREISRMLHFAWERIVAEIEKCDVRCANCHRIRTYTQLGWANKEIDALAQFANKYELEVPTN